MRKQHHKIQKICFSPNPHGAYRFRYEKDKKIILDTKTGYSLFDDKLKYPSIFENTFKVLIFCEEFNFTFEVCSKHAFGNDRRYRWNNADIIGVLKFICSPDDRRIILPSGIHDFMLEFRSEIYKPLADKCTIEQYRRLTSDIFIHLCITQGFSKAKANAMGNAVDFFQKYCQGRKWNISA